MIRTACQLLQLEGLLALRAAEDCEIGPDLPVDLLPRDPVCLSNEGNELLEIPVLVNGMMRSEPALSIYHDLALRARQYLPLIACEQAEAVGASVEVVLVLLEQHLELLHE